MNTTPSPIRIGVLGAGTVGAHVIHLLQQWSDEYERRLGTRLEVQSVLVRRLDAKRAFPIDSAGCCRYRTRARKGPAEVGPAGPLH